MKKASKFLTILLAAGTLAACGSKVTKENGTETVSPENATITEEGAEEGTSLDDAEVKDGDMDKDMDMDKDTDKDDKQ